MDFDIWYSSYSVYNKSGDLDEIQTIKYKLPIKNGIYNKIIK